MALTIYPVPTCVSSLGDPPKGGPCCPLGLRRDYGVCVWGEGVYRGYGWHLDVQDPGATLLEFVSQGWEEAMAASRLGQLSSRCPFPVWSATESES